jgi:hypothetical protein
VFKLSCLAICIGLAAGSALPAQRQIISPSRFDFGVTYMAVAFIGKWRSVLELFGVVSFIRGR